MSRLAEIDHKHDQLRALLTRLNADALWIQKTHNISWITAGANPAIVADNPTAPYSVIITADKRQIVTDNIEAPRIRAEEGFEELGFEFVVSPWYARQPPSLPNMISDQQDTVEPEMQKLRWVLGEEEKVRYRALGRDAAAALEGAIRTVRPGDSEWQIAARLDAGCREWGGMAVVNLVATDERVSKFRHPYITDKRLERYVMIVVCMRRGGLVVAATRLAHFGKLPQEIADGARRVARVDAAGYVATLPGRTLGDVLADIQQAYADVGEADQWRNHHQGGLIAYRPRERNATPNDPTMIQAGQAFAWNPSIVGSKSEDTILLGDRDFEIVTAASSDFPMIDVHIGGRTIRRPGVLEL
ncbi:MAG: M24 family metallopeptidase [Anaerolinea sp.]|nr:M24 family metallopeptidase [Anaerolinea sp.]